MGQTNPDRLSAKVKPSKASFLNYLSSEVTRGYELDHDEARYTARRQKMYTFMRIPRELEKFMSYGFFQCLDSFLFVFTFLPLRFILASLALIWRVPLVWLGLIRPYHGRGLFPAEIIDLLKGLIIAVCVYSMSHIDTSVMYHMIKSQSVIKLYLFYNMLEVGDRLFSAFGQDTIDALFWTATEPRNRKRETIGVIPHFLLAVTYVFLHTLLILLQATTLNVAVNASNKALLTIMMSNNFVELKGSVFKKFDKNNLFQVSCSDVRERFHLFALLFVVVVQTMKEYGWREESFWSLAPDCLTVLLAEFLVDWIKHAFITRFNEVSAEVYKDYTISLAYDLAQTKLKHALSDHSDLVSRRMGFIPLPLGVVMLRVLGTAIRFNGWGAPIVFFLAYLCLLTFRILGSIVILGKACDLIDQHQAKQQKEPTSSSNTTTGMPTSSASAGKNPSSRQKGDPSLANNDKESRGGSGGDGKTVDPGISSPFAPVVTSSQVDKMCRNVPFLRDGKCGDKGSRASEVVPVPKVAEDANIGVNRLKARQESSGEGLTTKDGKIPVESKLKLDSKPKKATAKYNEASNGREGEQPASLSPPSHYGKLSSGSPSHLLPDLLSSTASGASGGEPSGMGPTQEGHVVKAAELEAWASLKPENDHLPTKGGDKTSVDTLGTSAKLLDEIALGPSQGHSKGLEEEQVGEGRERLDSNSKSNAKLKAISANPPTSGASPSTFMKGEKCAHKLEEFNQADMRHGAVAVKSKLFPHVEQLTTTTHRVRTSTICTTGDFDFEPRSPLLSLSSNEDLLLATGIEDGVRANLTGCGFPTSGSSPANTSSPLRLRSLSSPDFMRANREFDPERDWPVLEDSGEEADNREDHLMLQEFQSQTASLLPAVATMSQSGSHRGSRHNSTEDPTNAHPTQQLRSPRSASGEETTASIVPVKRSEAAQSTLDGPTSDEARPT